MVRFFRVNGPRPPFVSTPKTEGYHQSDTPDQELERVNANNKLRGVYIPEDWVAKWPERPSRS